MKKCHSEKTHNHLFYFIEPRHPRYIRLPAEIFYYGGECGDDATIEEIKENFQDIVNLKLDPYIQTVCPPDETCIVEDIIVQCGPISNRKKRSLSWDIPSRHLRSQDNNGKTFHTSEGGVCISVEMFIDGGNVLCGLVSRSID